jgi:hypothetical protein
MRVPATIGVFMYCMEAAIWSLAAPPLKICAPVSPSKA